MLNLRQVLELADELRPGNVFSSTMKTRWVTEFEQMQQTEVLLVSQADLITYDYDKDPDAELLIAPPYDKLYLLYLMAQIDLASGDWEEYNNTLAVFNKAYADYMRYISRTIDPGSNEALRTGYYLSAYALAVKHGFSGTEEEWVGLQRGQKGADGFSPIVSVEALTGGHRVLVTDAKGETSFDVLDGKDGAQGAAGANGISPTVQVVPLSGGHRVYITDANRTVSFDVLNGTGAGDMTANVYDADGAVAALGGIANYVSQVMQEEITDALEASY